MSAEETASPREEARANPQEEAQASPAEEDQANPAEEDRLSFPETEAGPQGEAEANLGEDDQISRPEDDAAPQDQMTGSLAGPSPVETPADHPEEGEVDSAGTARATGRSVGRRYAIMLVTAAVFVALDHLTKWLVSSHLSLGEQWPSQDAFVNIHLIHNSGAAFGILPQFSYLYLVVAAVVAVYIILEGPSMGGGLWRLLALGGILGGALSNGIDRLIYGYVVDFIDFHFWLFQIFNVADIGIVGGMLMLVLEILVGGWRPEATERGR